MAAQSEDLSGTLLLKVNYTINPETRLVNIQHPSLSGIMGFEFTTLDLAKIQLQAIREDKPRSSVESILDDTNELVVLSGQLKDALKSFTK